MTIITNALGLLGKSIKINVVITSIAFIYSCNNQKIENTYYSKDNRILNRDDTAIYLLQKGFMKLAVDSGDIEGYYLIAKGYEFKDDTAQALHNFNLLLIENPNHFDGLLGRGIILNTMNKPELALHDLEKATKIKHDDYFALFHSGWSNYKLKRYPTALSFFESSAISNYCINNNCAQSYYYMGLIKIENLHDTLNGCVDLKKAIAIDPSIRQYLDEYTFCP